MSNSQGVRSVRNLVVTDLGIVSLLGIFSITAGTGVLIDFPGRGVIGLIAVVFAPGYAIVSALFPAHDTESWPLEQIQATVPEQNVTTVERLLLSVGLSVSLVPLVGIVLNYTAAGISASAILVVTGLITIATAGIATVRRSEIAESARFNPTLTAAAKQTVSRFGSEKRGSKLSLFLAIGFVVVSAGIGIAAIDADRGEQFSSIYLLSEEPDSGEYVADGYPETIQQGNSEDIRVGVHNHEDQPVEYTVIVQLQSVDDSGEITGAETVDEFTIDLEPGERWEETQPVSPEMTGEQLRLTYLLYSDQPPDSDIYDPADAYRTAHLWIDVT